MIEATKVSRRRRRIAVNPADGESTAEVPLACPTRGRCATLPAEYRCTRSTTDLAERANVNRTSMSTRRSLLATSIRRAAMTAGAVIAMTQQASAQMAQAARGAAEETASERIAGLSTRAVTIARSIQKSLDDNPSTTGALRQSAEAVILSATRASAVQRDRATFAARYAEFSADLQQLCGVVDTESGAEAVRRAAQCTALRESVGPESVTQDPFIFVSVPDVVFTVGYEYAAARREQSAVGAASLGTNLLGAAIGSAFNAIGSKPLQDYFTSNISAGLSIPSGNRTRLSGAVGVGLGGANFRGVGIYPALSFEQLDSADARIPGSLVSRRPKESKWSQATLGVAIAYPKLLENVANGQLGFIASIGIRLPHYYAGDPFEAIGAIFSSKRSDFERAGGSQFTFGVAIPLLKVKPQGGGVSTSNPGSGTSNQ